MDDAFGFLATLVIIVCVLVGIVIVFATCAYNNIDREPGEPMRTAFGTARIWAHEIAVTFGASHTDIRDD